MTVSQTRDWTSCSTLLIYHGFSDQGLDELWLTADDGLSHRDWTSCGTLLITVSQTRDWTSSGTLLITVSQDRDWTSCSTADNGF